jgi:hypothetical protein
LCQDEFHDCAGEEDILQENDQRLCTSHGVSTPAAPATKAEVTAEAEAVVPASGSSTAVEKHEDPLAVPAIKERVLEMVACEGGGPRASGLGSAANELTIGNVMDIVSAVEAVFTERGEKELRANCGGLLARDETYAFAAVDILHGKLAKREDAIPLGEKMRKVNKKVRGDINEKKRNAGKAAAAQRERKVAEAAAWELKTRAEPCADIVPFLPSAERCSAVQREAVKREEIKHEPKVEPAASAAAPMRDPAAVLARLRREVEKAEAAAVRADAHAVAARRRAEKVKKQRDKLLELRLEQSKGWHLDEEAWQQLLTARAAVDLQFEQITTNLNQLQREQLEAQVAADEAHYAVADAREGVASEEARRARRAERERESLAREQTARLEAERLEAEDRAAAEADAAERTELNWRELNLRADDIDALIARLDFAERSAARAKSAAESLHVWGIDHASRPTPKVFNLVGKSEAEVRAVASSVSQEQTPTEERVKLTKFSNSLTSQQ